MLFNQANYYFAGLLLLVNSFSCTPVKTVTFRPETGRYALVLKNQVLEVDPNLGGRITSFSVAGQNFLVDKAINSDNFGSTFWPSPQRNWNWPPIPEIDSKPYLVTPAKTKLILKSQADAKFGLIITKEFWVNRKTTSFIVQYTITNQSGQDQQVAPWEITRVLPHGLAFYPTGTTPKTGNLATFTEDKAGITWFNHNQENIPAAHLKLFADGAEGWLAQVNNNFILVKKFPDIPANQAAPQEGEIEIYQAQNKTYLEIEQQGPYQNLAPGQSGSWAVTWYLRELPAAIKPLAGNKALVDFVRKLIK